MQKIIILDFGSQTTQLIGRRVRELDTFCEIMPYNKFPKDDPDVIGVILSGSPYSVHDPEAFKVDLSQFVGRLPVLGICYGAQFISHTLGGKVEKADSREYGRANLQTVDVTNPLFRGFEQNSQVWMSHGDTITAIPEGFEVIGSTKDVQNAAFWCSPDKVQSSNLKVQSSKLKVSLPICQFPPFGTLFATTQAESLIQTIKYLSIMNIKPLGDRVLVLPAPAEEKIGGIIIPDTAKEKPLHGTIKAVGQGTKDEEMILKAGDEVLYGKYSGTELEFEGEKYLMMRQSDVLAVLEK